MLTFVGVFLVRGRIFCVGAVCIAAAIPVDVAAAIAVVKHPSPNTHTVDILLAS